MDTFWQKVKLWAKIVTLGVVVVLALTFVILNLGAVVEPELSLVFTSYDRPNFLLVMLLTSVFSVFGWWVFWLVFRAVRQLRTAGERSRTDRLEREVAEMKAKAAMLQTRPPDDDGV